MRRAAGDVGEHREPVGATVLAWLIPAIHEVPRAMELAGGVLVLLGIALSLGAGSGRSS